MSVRYIPSPFRPFADSLSEWGTGIVSVSGGLLLEPVSIIDMVADDAENLRTAMGVVNDDAEVSTLVRASSAAWDIGGDDTAVSTKVRASSAAWDAGGNEVFTDLLQGTVLTVNNNYYDSLTANRNFTFSGSPTDGNSIKLLFDATTTVSLSFPAVNSYRIGETSYINSLSFPTGNHSIKWTYADTKWWITDSSWDVSGYLDLSGGNLTGPLSSSSSGTFASISATNATFTGAISAASYLGLPAATGDDTSVSTKVRASSAYWDSTYTTVNAESASWIGGGGTANALPLSGGNLTGPLSSNSSGTFTTFYASNYLGLPTPIIGTSGVLTQAFVSTDTVTVTHSSNSYPIVQVLDNTGALFIPASITHSGLSAVTVTFYEARSGTVICSIVDSGNGGDYLPLSGGNLTGPLSSSSSANFLSLSATNATFIGSISAASYLGLPAGGSDDTGVSTKVRASSAAWDSTYTNVNANSATWGTGGDDTSVSTKVRSSSAAWDSTFTTVNSNSATTWNYQGVNHLPLSGGNLTGSLSSNSSGIFITLSATNATFTGNISAASYLGLPTYTNDDVPVSTKVRASSAAWDSTYTTVNSNSATTWNYQGVNHLPLSGGNLTGALSSNSSAKFITLSATDATFTGSISAASYLGLTTYTNDDTSVSTKVRASSAAWDSTFTTVNSNSATWSASIDDVPVSTKVRSSSAAWDSTFSTVNANSATTWNYQGIDRLPLSGGNLTGPLSSSSSGIFATLTATNATFTGAISAASYLGLPVPTTITVASESVSSCYIPLFYAETGNLAPKTNSNLWYDAYTETLNSTYVLVNSLTATNATFTGTISSASYLGLPTYTNDDTSVSTKVRSSSASWDGTYTTVNSNSATTWNYQGVDRLPLSGGNLTGPLSSSFSGIFATLSATDATFTGAISAASYLGLPASSGDDTSVSTKVRASSASWDTKHFGVSLDGGTTAIATGFKGFCTIPLSGTITRWSITADGVSPTATFDVWKLPTGTQTPVLSNTIMGVKPALATGNATNSTNLSLWDTTLRQYDIVGFYLDACAVATKLNLTIYYTPL